ncbi:MAG: hypothetical protein NTU57_02375 [Candidatus Aenigmarchaeota archaeon]|nr:hypothetical protein [Candidatus Aenigmarchaeota archaeon]
MYFGISPDCKKYVCIDLLKRAYFDPIEKKYLELPQLLTNGKKSVHLEGDIRLMRYKLEGLKGYFDLVKANQDGVRFKERVGEKTYNNAKELGVIDDEYDKETLDKEWMKKRILSHVKDLKTMHDAIERELAHDV